MSSSDTSQTRSSEAGAVTGPVSGPVTDPATGPVRGSTNRTRLVSDEALHEPDDSTIIWKYLDLAKYLSLLRSRCLHLAPATEFWDRYEGDIGFVQKRALESKYGRERYEEVMQEFQDLRGRTFVSCWTENEIESDAMWRIYTGASYGVAIRSRYGLLKSLLLEADSKLARYCGRVRYVDFKSHLLDLNCPYLPYFYKRKSFEHEREVRMILQDREGLDPSALSPRKDRANSGANSSRNQVAASSPTAQSAIASEIPSGPARKIRLSKGQLSSLILSVHLSPGAPAWFRELVGDLNRDYGLDREPLPSSLDEEPPL